MEFTYKLKTTGTLRKIKDYYGEDDDLCLDKHDWAEIDSDIEDDFDYTKLHKFFNTDDRYNTFKMTSSEISINGTYENAEVMVSFTTDTELSNSEIQNSISFFSGQFSDGWGEVLEQQEYKRNNGTFIAQISYKDITLI